MFAQKETPLYTICGKPCTGTIEFTEQEFVKCSKLLLPITTGDKIVSYVGSVLVKGTYVDLEVQGDNQNLFKSISQLKSGDKVVIGKVKMLHENKKIAAPSVVIQIK